jgi:hypothetical protein
MGGDVFTIADSQLAARANLTRKQRRHIKREVRAMQYRQVALRGGGTHEQFRRWQQIMTGRLNVANGLVLP